MRIGLASRGRGDDFRKQLDEKKLDRAKFLEKQGTKRKNCSKKRKYVEDN